MILQKLAIDSSHVRRNDPMADPSMRSRNEDNTRAFQRSSWEGSALVPEGVVGALPIHALSCGLRAGHGQAKVLNS